jgi:signal transduction histidine kinase
MRRRILLLVVGMTTLVVLAFAIPVVILTRNEVAQRAESSIAQQAAGIANTLRSTYPSDAELRTYVARQAAQTGHPVSVQLPDGTVVGSTPGDPDLGGVPDEHSPGDEHSGPGGPDGDRGRPPQLQNVAGGTVAVALAPGAGGGLYVVRVYLSDGKRYEGLGQWYLLIAAGSVGLLLLAGVAGEVLTRRITRPLVRTADTAQRLSTGDVTARAPTTGPREIADVGAALNRLADRIDRLIADERETVADLSHRLRTPLTSLRLDAEALRDPAEAERVGARVTDIERTLTAVIHAARRPQREGRMPFCDATAVVARRVEFWSALTEDQGRRSSVVVPSRPVLVRAAAEDLAAAVDALLENIVAHTPEGTAFAVTLTADAIGARLDVADEGPGIPPAAELRGRSDRGSSGLGLDIARRCAEASGGSMLIGASPSGGALVTLVLRSP